MGLHEFYIMGFILKLGRICVVPLRIIPISTEYDKLLFVPKSFS